MSKLLSPPENGYAIVGDIHGRADLLLRATELIDPATTRFVVQDMLDKGPEVRKSLQIAQDIGAIALADNMVGFVQMHCRIPNMVNDFGLMVGTDIMKIPPWRASAYHAVVMQYVMHNAYANNWRTTDYGV
jgi:hypothetical protein